MLRSQESHNTRASAADAILVELGHIEWKWAPLWALFLTFLWSRALRNARDYLGYRDIPTVESALNLLLAKPGRQD